MSLAFVFGLLASLGVIFISLLSKPRPIQFASLGLGSVTFVQYVLLGEFTAATLSAVSVIASLVLLLFSGRFLFFQSKLFNIILLSAYTVAFFSLNGLAVNEQLLAYGGSVTMVAVMLVKNPFHVKYLMLVAGVCWTWFAFAAGAYGMLFGQVFYFVGTGWSLWRLFVGAGKSRAGSELSVHDEVRESRAAELTAA